MMHLLVSLFAGGVLGDGLGALRDGVLGQFTGQEEADGRLHLATGDGGALVVVRQAAGLGGDALEDVIDEGVHDGHGLGGDARVRVHLLQHLVDVDGEGLLALVLALLLVGGAHGLLGLAALLDCLAAGWGSHFGLVSWESWRDCCWTVCQRTESKCASSLPLAGLLYAKFAS